MYTVRCNQPKYTVRCVQPKYTLGCDWPCTQWAGCVLIDGGCVLIDDAWMLGSFSGGVVLGVGPLMNAMASEEYFASACDGEALPCDAQFNQMTAM